MIMMDPEEVWGHRDRGEIKNHTVNITKVHNYLHDSGKVACYIVHLIYTH